MDKAAYLGVLGSSTYMSHLLLDDIVRASGNHLLYMLTGIGTTSFILGMMIFSLFALDQPGIKIEYWDET